MVREIVKAGLPWPRNAPRHSFCSYHLAFHQNPFTLSPLVAYFTLKDYEAALLKTAVAAIALAVPEQDVLAIVGAQ